MALFLLTVSDPNYPQTTKFSTFCIAIYTFVVGGIDISNLVGRLIVVSSIPRMTKQPWIGHGQVT